MIAHSSELRKAGAAQKASGPSKTPVYPPRQEPQEETAAFSQLQTLLKEEKVYLNPDLRISELAERMDTNTKYLSQLIKNKSGLNFNGFINRYRVEEVKQKIEDPQYQHLTLAALAESSGFASASTFSRAFKQETGLLPKEFQQQSVAKT